MSQDFVKVTTEPTVEPVSLDEFKLHLRIESDETDEDDVLIAYLSAARRWCEQITRRSFVEQTLTWQLDGFPCGRIPLLLPKPPLISVTSVQYVDTAGAPQTWTSSLYKVDALSEPGRMAPAYSESWPTARDEIGAVTIVYKAGYQGDGGSPVDAALVPPSILQAIKMLGAHWYRNREALGDKMTPSGQLALSVDALLWPERVFD